MDAMSDEDVRKLAVPIVVVMAFAGCAGSAAKVQDRPSPGPTVVAIPPPTATNGSPTTAAPLDPRQASAALSRAYADGDEATIRSVASQVFASLSDAEADAGAPRPSRNDRESLSADGQRFFVATPRGLFLGSAKGTHIDAFLPELVSEKDRLRFLPDSTLIAIRTPPAMESDACRLTAPEEEQERIRILDFNTRKVVLDRRGRLAGAGPNRKSLLITNGNESVLTLYDVDAQSERTVSFAMATVRGNPLPWKPTNCATSCSKAGCSDGAPFPWNLRDEDVAYSPDGSYVALNWNGFSRGEQQGVTVHDASTGTMVASFLTTAKADFVFSPQGSTIGILLSSKKAKLPYSVQDTLLLFDADKRMARVLGGCAFATDRVIHLGFTSDGARVAVRWDLSSAEHDSEACEFEVASSRFVGKMRPGDPRYGEFRFEDHDRAGQPFHLASVAFWRELRAHVCSKGGYLFPQSACPAP
jgi:hypothetical protein